MPKSSQESSQCCLSVAPFQLGLKVKFKFANKLIALSYEMESFLVFSTVISGAFDACFTVY